MSLETRSSAHFKRAEQLRRWEDSETNREPAVPKVKSSKVQFSSSCAFLGACYEGDKEEMLNLLQKGIDINTTNVDGLTALHQACIEDNLDMVEFLVQNGADVNIGDNEGWTPLHATASCGHCSIAKYLIENGADVAAVNNDGQLAIDIAESDEMVDLLQEEFEKRGIDCELARGEEQRCMLQDARDWVAGNTNNNSICVPNPKNGATALHIAAAKGYIDVMQILLQNELVDVDQQDYDGWTPLHAAAHWGQREAAKLLVDNLADMEIKNYYRQTPFDVADPDMLKFLEDLKVKQSSLNREIVLGKRQAKQKSNAPAKIKKVELEIEKDKTDENEDTGALDNHVVDLDLSLSSDTDSYSSETETSSDNITDDEKKNRVNAVTSPTATETNRIYPPPVPTSEQNSISKPPPPTQAPTLPPKAPDNIEDVTTIPSWRRPASFRSRIGNESPTKSPLTLRIGDKDQRSPTSPTARNADSDVVLRRTHSFENDEKFKLRYMELQERIKKANSLYPIPGSPDSLNPIDTQKTIIITRFGLLPSPQKTDKSNLITNITQNTNNTQKTKIDNTLTECNDDDQKLAHLNQLRNKNNAFDTIDQLHLTPPNPLTRSSSLRTDRWLSDSKEPTSNKISTTTSPPVTPTTPTVTVSTANTTSPNKTTGSPTATSPQPNTQVRSVISKPPVSGAPPITTVVTPATPPTPGAPTTPSTPTTPTAGSKLTPGNIFKNFFKSFVPPVRDEESETQRKAHAKRVRETRRSTQGVTLDEIKSAEQLVKKKNQSSGTTPVVNNSTDQQNSTETTSTAVNNTTANGDTTNTVTPTVSATITTATPTVVSRETTTEEQPNSMSHERRPSWRLRVDNGSKFKLEDASVNTTASPTVFVRRTGSNQGPVSVRPSSAPVESSVPPSPPADTVVTLPLRRNAKSLEDKEQDKENDVRNAQATQAVIQRRRRPKRRSTGVVHVDMDEIDPDKQDTNAGGDYDEPKVNHQESGSEEGSGRTSRLGSTSDSTSARNENGEIDYKKLWEQSEKERLRQQAENERQRAENERLREKLHKQEEELREAKSALEKLSAVQTNKSTLSEMEKRERRAMERKLSEMEEELKQLEALKVENQRLKDENGALIRVISKLSK